MFARKIRKESDLKHFYSNALHTLLSQNQQGLLAPDIADMLRISEKECEKLLYKEQLLGTLDVDPYSGHLVYRSKKNFSENSLDTELEKARKRYFISKVSSMKIILFPIALSPILFALNIFNFNINIGDNLPLPEKPERVGSGSNQPLYPFNNPEEEREELTKIKKILENDSKSNSCSVLWKQSAECYVRNRLYSEREFNKELKRIDERIQQVE